MTGTLLALDPALAALIGALVLDEPLTVAVVLGIALVVASGAAVARRAGAGQQDPGLESDPSPGHLV